MKKVVLTFLAVSVLSLNFVSASSSDKLSYLGNLENSGKVGYDPSTLARPAPQLCVVTAGLVFIAATLMTSATWTNVGGIKQAEDSNIYNLD